MTCRVEPEDQNWELDFNSFNPEKEDPFGETPSLEKFKVLMNEIWVQRREVQETNQNIDFDRYEDPLCELELESVIGRRAVDRRNNVRFDNHERIIYNASSLVVFMEENEDFSHENEGSSKIKQTFLRPNDDKFTSLSPEVSCFALSRDLRIVAVGTSQIEAQVQIWEISTNLQLSENTLPWCSIISAMKIAHDGKHIIIIGLTRDYFQAIFLYDFARKEVITMRQIMHSLPYKIKYLAL